MKIDTGDRYPDIPAISAAVEEGQYVRITDHRRAQNIFNKIRQNVESHEDVAALDEYVHRESLTLDALYLFDPFAWAELREAYETHRTAIAAGGLARRALPGIPPNSPFRQYGNHKR